MNEENTGNNTVLADSVVEKSVDIAKGFIERLVMPTAEELGLLIKDQISLWRFNNQVKILTKAKLICEKNNISVKAISPKLLCPYLEHASLEDNDELQEKWANLLANMVNSDKNIQNHVFPYILSQLSIDEYLFLECVVEAKEARIKHLEDELFVFQRDKERIRESLEAKLDKLKQKHQEMQNPNGNNIFVDSNLHKEMKSTEREISMLKYRENILLRKIESKQKIEAAKVKEFEIANIIRLGLARVTFEASALTNSLEIPGGIETYTSVDLDIEIETESTTVLTELGELFINACRIDE